MTNNNDKIYENVSRPDGTVGVRDTLNKMGINNSQIGYDEGTKTVTLGGKTLLKPSYIDEDAGISYASPSDIKKSLTDYYSKTSNPIVKVSDAYSNYAGEYGLKSDALSYSNGTVTVGGKPIDILFTDDDGKAWAFSDSVQNSVSDYINSLGITTPNDVLNQVNSKYLSPLSSLIKNIQNRSEFEYDPESDPVYQAYKTQYLTEGKRASENAMANYSSMTGGYANSAAATAAAQAQQYYMQQLTNQIPSLAEAAYKRYSDSMDNDLSLLGTMLDVYEVAYNNADSANRRTTENINTSSESNTSRDNVAFSKYWENMMNEQEYRKNEQDFKWTDILNSQKSELNQSDLESNLLDNSQKRIYLEYYNDLLKSELEGNNLNNRLTEEKINQLILQNMYGIF